MKKMFMVVIIVTFLVSMGGNAWAIYTPTGNPVPSKVDIAEAERVMNGLKWDLSQASKGTIKLTIPKTSTKYGININRNSLRDDGVSAADGGNIYMGAGGTTLTVKISLNLRTIFNIYPKFGVRIFQYQTQQGFEAYTDNVFVTTAYFARILLSVLMPLVSISSHS
ncbi:MAG: hypothetical protein WA118_11685 [Carboxydocellales bacterium]